MGRYYDSYWPPYVPVAERRRKAAQKVAKMKKAGKSVSSIEIDGRKITSTFWGNAWCKNLEAYSDYSNRLPRGRTYVRNGSVIDLQIETGRVKALVSGTDLYTVDIKIKPLPKKKWIEIKKKCAGQIDSLVELLRGSFSKGVMEIVTRKGQGLFPSPREIDLDCSCPDWATMCKHVAATLYGVGSRLDHEPELLFKLRGVDLSEMVEAAIEQPTGTSKKRKGRILQTDELSSVFGVDIDIDGITADEATTPTKQAKKTRRATKVRKTAANKTSTKKRTAKKATAKKVSAKKTASTKKRAAKKSAAKKSAAKKSALKKAVTKKTGTKKAAAKKSTKKKVTPKKAAAKKVTTKKSTRKKTSTTISSAKKSPTKKTKQKKTATKKSTVKRKAVKKPTTKTSAASKKKPAKKTTAKRAAKKDKR
jgi:uncharacterized Zn finger protein